MAPFDDILICFASPSSPILKNLYNNPRVSITASDAGKGWQLNMRGRAVFTGAVHAHPRRMELQHWLPEGVPSTHMVVLEFLPHHIEYSIGEADVRRRYEGALPGGCTPPFAVRWWQATFGGIMPAVVVCWLAMWLWVGVYAQEFRFRWLALVTGLVASMCLLAGARLVYRVQAMSAWQKGRARRADAGVLGLGWVAQASAVAVAFILWGVSLFAMVFMGVAWGGTPLLVVLAASQLWWLAPVWIIHLAQKCPEAPGAG